jgi:hypothetical protein
MCETLVSFGGSCTQPDACNSGLGLSCQSSKCECNSTQFWSTSSLNCINYYTYNAGACTSDNQCTSGSNLICRTSGTSCNCPINLATNGKCDCPTPVSGKEYYWNGLNCTTALSYNQTCSASYMCQTLTQLTSCIGSKCTCSSSEYWKSSLSKCISCPTGGWIYHRFV